MVTFLFWNINGKPLLDSIEAIAQEESVDVLILAECRIEARDLLQVLNRKRPEFHLARGISSQLVIYTRFPREFMAPAFDGNRVSIRRLRLPARLDVLLVAVHFPSKLRWSDESQMLECTQLSHIITAEEMRVGHRRTIVVGDLNMNPFEKGMVGAAGLHAVPTRNVAERGGRVVQGRTYPFFYNPMWGHFGDRSERPPGSYYYERAEQVSYFWHTFDQVLIRPQLMDRLRADQVRILDKAGDSPLATEDGHPDVKNLSDHFPLLFRLDL